LSFLLARVLQMTMTKILLSLVLLLLAPSANAQGGCSDAGVCTLGGHSTAEPDGSHRLTAGLTQVFALATDYSYFETVPRIGYDLDLVQLDLSLLYRVANARYASEPVRTQSVISGGGKLPAIQHVTVETNKIMTHYALGDAKLAMTIPVDEIATGLDLNFAWAQPLTKLYEDRPQEMQSTLGLPSFLGGLSYDRGDDALSYGATVAYQTTFGEENALHLTRADDLALALRMRGELSTLLTGGLDASFIQHLDEDKLHSIPTGPGSAMPSTKGLTINLGGSLSTELSASSSLGLYVAAPILSKAHVDGLERSFVSGLFLNMAW
jgi:hypothetical protein